MEVIRDYDRVLLIELDVWVINCVRQLRVSGDSLTQTDSPTHTQAQTLVVVTKEDVTLVYIHSPRDTT